MATVTTYYGYVLDRTDNRFYVYNLSTGARESSREWTFTSLADTEEGAFSDGTHVWILPANGGTAQAYLLSNGNRASSMDITLPSAIDSPRGGTVFENHAYIVDSNDTFVYCFNLATRQRVNSREFNLASASSGPRSIATDGTYFYIGESGGGRGIRAYTTAGVYTSSENIAWTSENDTSSGLFINPTHLWSIDDGDNKAYAYLLSNGEHASSLDVDFVTANADVNGGFSVQVTIPNNAPVVAISTPDQFVAGGATISLAGTVTDADTGDTLTASYSAGSGTFSNQQFSNGAATAQWTAPAATSVDQAIVITLTGGDGEATVIATVTMTVRAIVSVAASFTAGNPTLAADLTAIESEPLQVAVSLRAGNSTLEFALTAVAPIEQVAVQLQAGNPTLAADATALAPITENTIRARDNEIVRALITVGDSLNWFTPPGASGTVTGDLEVEAGLEIGYIRVTRNNNGDFLTFRRPPGATTGDMNAAFGPGGTFEDSFIHLERHLNAGEADGAQITSFQISSMRASSGANWLALGPFPNTSDYSAFIDTVAAGERINFVIGDAAFAAIPVAAELSAGSPTLDFNLSAVDSPPESVAVSLEAGNPTLSFDLTAQDSPPMQVATSLRAGDPTLDFDLSAVDSAPQQVAFSLAAGDPTLEFALTGIPAPEQVAVEFTAGNPTLAAALTAIDALNINTIPRRATEYVRALLTASGGSEPSEWIGSASSDSDLTLTSDLIIDRIRFWTSDNRMFLNHSGTGAFSNFFGADNTGEDAHIYIAVEGQTTIIDIDIADNLANRGGQAAVAALRIRQIPTNFAAILDNIASGTKVNFVIADPAHAIETELRAGNPTLAADLTAVESEPLAVAVSLRAGNPTLEFALTGVGSAPLQVAVDMRAGDPTLAFDLTSVDSPPQRVAVEFTAGQPTLAADLTSVPAPTQQLGVAFRAGDPTLTFEITGIDSPPQQIATSLRAGNPTLAFALTQRAAPLQVAVALRAGNATLSFDVTAVPPPVTYSKVYTLNGNDVTRDITETGVTCERSIDFTYPVAGLKAGIASFELWDVRNVYGQGGTREVKRGQSFTIAMLFSGHEHPQAIWSGVISDVNVLTRESVRLLKVTALGDISRLVSLPANTTVRASITTGEAAHALVDPTDVTNVEETGGVTLTNWYGSRSMGDALNLLVATEGGDSAFIERKQGGTQFWTRNRHTLETRARTAQAVFQDGSGTGGFVFHRPLVIERPLELLVNTCDAIVVPLELASAEDSVWRYVRDIELTAGQVLIVTARFTRAASDIQVPTLADGDFTVGSGQVAPAFALSRTSGPSVDITITAGSAVTLSDFRLRGKQLEAGASLLAANQFRDMESETEFGEHHFGIDLAPGASLADAESQCTGIVRALSQGIPIVHVPVILSDAAQALHMIGLDLGDRVSIIQETGIEFNAEAHIIGIRHAIHLTGHPHEIVFSCIPAGVAGALEMVLDDPDDGVLDTNVLGA